MSRERARRDALGARERLLVRLHGVDDERACLALIALADERWDLDGLALFGTLVRWERSSSFCNWSGSSGTTLAIEDVRTERWEKLQELLKKEPQ